MDTTKLYTPESSISAINRMTYISFYHKRADHFNIFKPKVDKYHKIMPYFLIYNCPSLIVA